MKDNTLPPKFNNNYEGIDPIGGFDFHVYYKDEQIAKFQNMTISVKSEDDLLPKISWVLEQGVINKDFFSKQLNIELKEGEVIVDKDKEISIVFESVDRDSKSHEVSGYYKLNTTISGLQLGVMPGRRVAVVKMSGERSILQFVPKL